MNTLDIVTFPCFTLEQVKKINEEIKKNKESYNVKRSTASYTTKTGEFFRVPCLKLMELLHPWLYKCQWINKETFGYTIYWDLHHEYFNYNLYGIGGEYDWHVDAGVNNSPHIDTKLTCLLNLSEEVYEGGEFYTILQKEKKPKFTSGMGLVMNSLIAHKVAPVTAGKRVTVTYWGMGPTWK